MKGILFCLFFLPLGMLAQVYVPFISTTDSTDTWKDVHSCSDFSCFYSYTNRYTIEGDTAIGSYQYSKVYISFKYEEGTDAGQWCNESINYYEHYFGAIREAGKQIFLLPNLSSLEYLAYDFNLLVGDTLPSPDGNLSANSNGRIINSIDSVFVFGSYRKKYVVNNYKYIIEGIGASTGLFNPMVYYPSECYMAMLCYSEYGIPDLFLQDCNMNLNVRESNENSETPILIKIVDIVGRETTIRPNTPLIYICSDGTARKIFKFE